MSRPSPCQILGGASDSVNMGLAASKPGQLYFAYGSNLSLEGMDARCPDAKPIGPAILHDWALTFQGVADIEPRAGTRTHGALWRISDSDLERLDRYEGYPGLYRRELVAVCTEQAELT